MKKFLLIISLWLFALAVQAQNQTKLPEAGVFIWNLEISSQTTFASRNVAEENFGANDLNPMLGGRLGFSGQKILTNNFFVAGGLSVDLRSWQFDSNRIFQFTDANGSFIGAADSDHAFLAYSFGFSLTGGKRLGRVSLATGVHLRLQSNPSLFIGIDETLSNDVAEIITFRSWKNVYLDIPVEIAYHIGRAAIFSRYERSLTNRLHASDNIREFDNTIMLGARLSFGKGLQ